MEVSSLSEAGLVGLPFTITLVVKGYTISFLCLLELDFKFYIEFSIEKSDRVLKGSTCSRFDFKFYIEFSIEKSDRVLKGLMKSFVSFF